MLLKCLVGAALALCCLSAPTWAACSNTVTALDGGGISRTFCRGTDSGGSNYANQQQVIDGAGNVLEQGPAARHFPGCTVGTSSAACLAAATAATFVQVQNNSATATVACSWGGTAALNSATSFQLAPGQSASWGQTTGGIPNEALNCIASVASTPLYVEYN